MNHNKKTFIKNLQYYKFCAYGFLKNLRFFEPFLFLFFIDKGLNFLQIGILYSIREITTNISEIPSGIIADAIGRKKAMIISFISYIISFIIFYFSSNYIMLISAILFFSFGEAFRTGTHKAMILEYLNINKWQNQKVYYYGHTRSYSQIGSAVSALIAGIIVFFSNNYNSIFLFSVIPYLLDLFLIISYPKKLDGKLCVSNKNIKTIFKLTINEFIKSLKNMSVIKAISNQSVFSGFFKSIKDYLQPMLKTFALSIPLLLFIENKQRTSIIISVVYFIIYVLTSISARNSGSINSLFKKIYRPINITLILGFITALLIGIFINFNLLILSIILFLLLFMIENIRKPMGFAYVSDIINQNITATILSAQSQIKTLTAAICAPFLGFLADKYGIGIGLIIISSLMIIITPFIIIKPEKIKKTL